jgi:ABC-type antimicrobial peptide transport system permease subunit
MALGARPDDVVRMVIGQGAVLAVAGVAIGVVAALALSRLISGLLWGVSATDPLTYVAMAALFVLVVGAASWIPARRAARVDPMSALRAE